MIDTPMSLLILGGGAVVLTFALLWLDELRTHDASLVDVGWAAALGGLSILYSVLGSGTPQRRLWLGIVIGAWSLRLASHIYSRHRNQPEDGRYQALRASWGERAHTFFFFFYQAQGVLALVLSIPFLLIAFNPSPVIEPMEIAGFALAAAALLGETIADRQLERHRTDPDNRGRTCRTGLWRYSRHPNYFFEWLIWCGVALVALSAPYGWLGLVSPLLMWVSIVKVTGIPPTEERALVTRGDDYRDYQATTSAFIPWFPKKESTS